MTFHVFCLHSFPSGAPLLTSVVECAQIYIKQRSKNFNLFTVANLPRINSRCYQIEVLEMGVGQIQ